MIELKKMTSIETKLDALMNKLGNQERRLYPTHEARTVEESDQKSSAEEGLTHEGPYQVEELNFLVAKKFTTLSQTLTCQLITHQH